jgi:hypothetical protein
MGSLTDYRAALQPIASINPMSLQTFNMILAQASSNGPSPSAQWAIVGFLMLVGLLITLSPARRTFEVKRPKDE